jgi:hypothetical protein
MQKAKVCLIPFGLSVKSPQLVIEFSLYQQPLSEESLKLQ